MGIFHIHLINTRRDLVSNYRALSLESLFSPKQVKLRIKLLILETIFPHIISSLHYN
jgi:hypothetical protein